MNCNSSLLIMFVLAWLYRATAPRLKKRGKVAAGQIVSLRNKNAENRPVITGRRRPTFQQPRVRAGVLQPPIFQPTLSLHGASSPRLIQRYWAQSEPSAHSGDAFIVL